MKNVEIYKFEESTESKDLIAAPEPIVSIQPAACTETPHTPLDIARSYEKRGWLPLPVPYGKKECHLRAWPDLRHGRYNVSDHFSEAPLNVGISLGEPSGGLVDIDLDCPEATRIAEAILPHTDCIFGRKGNARSHWIYRTDVAGAREFFSDPTSGEMLVEYRGNGCMTFFPEASTGPVSWWNLRKTRTRLLFLATLSCGGFGNLLRRH